MYVSASNSRWIGPHPATGVWAAGLLPTQFRTALLERKHGVDILRAVSFVSPGSRPPDGRGRGIYARSTPARFSLRCSELEHRSALFSLATHIYAALAKAPVFRSVLVVAGPMFQSMFVKEKTM